MVNQDYEVVPIDTVEPHPQNPRVGDVEAIRASIRANQFYGVCVVQRSTGYILAGSHRWKAAKAEGLAEVPVVWKDVEGPDAIRILLADNRTADLGGYDHQLLDSLIEGLGELEIEGSGWDLSELEAIERRREEQQRRDQEAAKDETNDPLPIPDDEPIARQYGVLVVCTDEDEQRQVYDKVRGLGREVRVLSI